MTSLPRSQWLPFNEYFELAHRRGFDLVDAAEKLLGTISDVVREPVCRGIERQWDLILPTDDERRARHDAEVLLQELATQLEVQVLQPSERLRIEATISSMGAARTPEPTWQERLPRRPLPVIVPMMAWDLLHDVSAACTSSWCDDDESPSETVEVDWVSGSLEFVFEVPTSTNFLRTSFSALHVDRAVALPLLKSNPIQGPRLAQPRVLPPLPDKTLQDWWNALPPQTRSKDRDRVILKLCIDAHPGFKITKRRVRDLPPRRDRGRPQKYAPRR